MYGRIGRIHFVGIGGTGMNGIAEVLLDLGYKVSGSDLATGPVTDRLAARGGIIHQGHDAAHVKGASVVVTSTAVQSDNPEVRRARELGIPVIPRAEMLAELMRAKYAIAVAGAHGKTTTTSMVAGVLTSGGLDPTVVVGGRVLSLGSNARTGKGQFLVAEADESDGSFLKLLPSIAVITNIDAEHLDHWTGGINQIRNAFVEFANKVPFYGVAVVCLDDDEVLKALPSIMRRVKTYGLAVQSDFVARDVRLIREDGTARLDYELVERRQPLGRIQLSVSGRHNVLNSLAAAAVGRELDIPFEKIQAGLKSFTGVARRLELKGMVGDIRVIDDYGHHPTEVLVVLATLKEAFAGRVLVVFQPHRYTRTRDFHEAFGRAFHDADRLFLLPVYAAGEAPIAGADSESIAAAARGAGHKAVELLSGLDEAVERVAREARPGDVILTLGAGDVTKLGEKIVARLGGGA